MVDLLMVMQGVAPGSYSVIVALSWLSVSRRCVALLRLVCRYDVDVSDNFHFTLLQ